tara:strand:- start:580 stop:1080 length:501 start_codon:yes stop_codon:yes gene_type:complete
MEKVMKITKQRLKDIIKEELDAMRGAERPGAGIEDIAASEEEEVIDRAFGSPEERLLILIKAREALGNMTRDELKDLSMSLDAPMFATLQHILANPMYAPMQEGWGQGDRAYQQATQLLGKHAEMHGLRNRVADALRQKRVSPQQVQKAAQGAVSSYQVAQRLGLG